MTRATQIARVREKLFEDGQVDNFWAIENYILRLGAIICEFRKEGLEIEWMYGKKLGMPRPLWKNSYYILKTGNVIVV